MIQDCLIAGVKVLNTAVKKVGRPDLTEKKLNNSAEFWGRVNIGFKYSTKITGNIMLCPVFSTRQACSQMGRIIH